MDPMVKPWDDEGSASERCWCALTFGACCLSSRMQRSGDPGPGTPGEFAVVLNGSHLSVPVPRLRGDDNRELGGCRPNF